MHKIVDGLEVPLTIREIEEFNAREIKHNTYLNSDEYKEEQFKLLNADILDQLKAIDQKSIRSLRINDTEKLAELEQQAIELRKKLYV
jgi:hypothetical protein